MYPGIELRLIRYVTVLAEELNFTRAALRLHVAQPSLSKQIKELEDYLKVKLFDRTKREVRLTPAGEAFAKQGRHAMFHAERAVEEARAANGHQKGPWLIAYSPLIDRRILSKIRHHLFSANPTTDIRLVSAFTSEQADALAKGNLKAGLVILPVRDPRISCEAVHREPLVLALPERHALVAKPEIEITDLDSMPLVTMRADFEPRFGEDLLRIGTMLRIRLRVFHRATTCDEVLEVATENGLAALTILSAHHPVPDGLVFRRFADDFLAVESGLAYLRETSSPILNSLRSFLSQTFHPLGNGMHEDQGGQMKLF